MTLYLTQFVKKLEIAVFAFNPYICLIYNFKKVLNFKYKENLGNSWK